MEEYAREDTTHINGIEGFELYQGMVIYHYHGVPRHYFHLYMKEVEFRFNNRDKNLFADMVLLLTKSVEDN